MTIEFIPPSDFNTLSSGNPLPALTRVLTEIWDAPFDELNHSELESKTRVYEDFLFDTSPKIFSDILPRMTNEYTRVENLYQRGEDGLVLMDGMSIREMFPLSYELEQEGFSVNCEFAMSTTPTKTLYYRKQKMGSEDFSSLDNIELVRTDQVSWLGDMNAWCMVPDDFFDQWSKTRKSLGKPDRIYEECRDHLVKILENVSHNNVVVTSDHGYILPYAGSTREAPPDIKGYLKEVFGNSREAEINESNVETVELLKNHDVVVESDGYASIVGRYSWGGGDRPVHGGVSLLETITPYMEVKK